MRSSEKFNIITHFMFVILVFAQSTHSLDLLEFIFGPRLGSGTLQPKSLNTSPAQILVETQGYPFETHEVTSKSGHILVLHRIPNGRKKTKSIGQKQVALFQHGLFAASDTWLFRGSEQDLPYILADAGYDVWMSNMRGNFYSKKHTSLNANKDASYWNFSLEDIALYDLPRIIDYILNVSKHKNLYYLGHSVGSTVGLILCALRPEYNLKIKAHLSLAPLVYVIHPVSFIHKMVMNPMQQISKTLMDENILAIFPRRKYFSKLLELICRNGMPTQQLCIATLFLVVGADYPQFNTTIIPEVVTYYPSGTSLHLAMHTLEIYTSGKFGPYSFGTNNSRAMNDIAVNQTPYNISQITHPVVLFYGSGDSFVTEEDISYLDKQLPNSGGKVLVPYKNFNHMDFMWGIDAKNLLYERILKIMSRYK